MTFSKEFFSIYVQLIKNNIQYLVLYKLVALYFQRHFQHMNLAAETFGKIPLEVSEAVVRRCSSKYVIWKTSQILHENTCVAVSL